MYWKPIVRGALSYVPGFEQFRGSRTCGSGDPRYCYSVWLRHLVLAHRAGLPTRFDTVAELGPGDSLGLGLAALLSGARRYYAFDVVRYAHSERNQMVLQDLARLFRARAPIPDAEEFPLVAPRLSDYSFPSVPLDADRLNASLAPQRVDSIARALRGEPNAHDIEVEYRVPWDQVVEPKTVDLVFSQACLEHVDDLDGTYDAMLRWLRPGAFISHQIDFQSHGITTQWDGHWRFSGGVWRVIRGRRPWLINREPHSSHLQAIRRRFDVRTHERRRGEPQTSREDLARRFRSMSDEDRTTTGVFVQAVKPAGA